MSTPDLPLLSPPEAAHPGPGLSRGGLLLRLLWLLTLLFGFLVAIETMSKAIKSLAEAGILGGVSEEELFTGVGNPFAGIALGVLFTTMVQSSSTTTATVVAIVGSGALSVEHAVPIVMGANIGTTITNTLVSIGHVSRANDFRRAFAAATVHDFFNLMAVAVFLPLEIATRFLSRSAAWLSAHLAGGSGSEYKSPLKGAIKAVHGRLMDYLEAFGLGEGALGVVALVTGIALTILCLILITRNMRVALSGRIEAAMNEVLKSNALVGLALGAGITVAVQSSSITTSLLVPMCAAGVLHLKRAFPVMLGANIGTTVTAVLASLAQDRPAALTIALVHVLFNALGVMVVLPFPVVRNIPIRLARGLALRASRNVLWVVGYVLGTFVAVPLIGWLLWSG